MAVQIRRKAVESFFLWTQSILIGTGILVLGYCSFMLVDAKVFQAYEGWRFQTAVPRQLPQEVPQLIPSALSPAILATNRRNLEWAGIVGGKGPLGRLEISSVGLTVMVFEGTEERTLRRAVGHIPGTALPGQSGNVAIAGHRDTFFRALRKIHENDLIELTTLSGSYRYRVNFTKVVEPSNIDVLRDSDNSTLTLVTCYPFQYIGAAPERFVVRALQTAEATTVGTSR